MRYQRIMAASAGLALAFAATACNRSSDQGSATTTSGAGRPPAAAGSGTTAPADPLADAKTAVVEFFEAKAVNDYDKALGRSSGSAALTVRWACEVNGIQAVAPMPWASSSSRR